ncbi:MAG: hypothetical protein R3C19_23235 [Planctomycetaceae bacterium]
MKITRRRVLIMLWMAGLLTPCLWAVRLFLGRPTAVEVSAETTFLVGEKLADGSLDFSKALYQHCNFPVDDSLNAAIGLMQLPELPRVEDLYRIIHLGSGEPPAGYENDGAFRRSRLWDTGVREIRRTADRPWTAERFPTMAKVVAAEETLVLQWKAAVAKPRLVKPLGVTTDELRNVIVRGARILQRRAMLAAGEGRWDDAIDDLKSVDHAAELLAQLQCGWETYTACTIHHDVCRVVSSAVLNSTTVNPQFSAYIRERSEWPVHEVVARAVDQAVRIHFQLAVRDCRERNSYLQWYVGGGLISNDAKARELQLTQIRNSIDWSTVSRIQNEVVSEFVDALGESEHDEYQVKWNRAVDVFSDWNRNDLIEEVRMLDLSRIPERLGYALANSSYETRVRGLHDRRDAVKLSQQASLTSLAIAEYRQQNGQFPDTLNQLPKAIRAGLKPYRTGQQDFRLERDERSITLRSGDSRRSAWTFLIDSSNEADQPESDNAVR